MFPKKQSHSLAFFGIYTLTMAERSTPQDAGVERGGTSRPSESILGQVTWTLVLSSTGRHVCPSGLVYPGRWYVGDKPISLCCAKTCISVETDGGGGADEKGIVRCKLCQDREIGGARANGLFVVLCSACCDQFATSEGQDSDRCRSATFSKRVH